MSSNKYSEFLESKKVIATAAGLDVPALAIHPILYDFQRDIVCWALRRGRAAIFADCGLGKSFMQLEWCRHVHSRLGQSILIVAPLSVAEQTIREARRLDLDVTFVRSIDELSGGIHITNYEMLWHFIRAPLSAIVLDESSILKSIDGETRRCLLDHFTDIPYRLCCTATPCPNDVAELANHSEFLGVMKRQEMLASFFVHDDEGWRLRGHAAKPFYRWLASWAMALKNPADLGYDGAQFILPPLEIHDEVVKTEWRRPGALFAGGLHGITDRAAVRKQSVRDRVQRAADIANATKEQVIVWCGLNEESALVAACIPDSVPVSGNDPPSVKVLKILRFIEGDVRVLVSKVRICGFGMNFQNTSRMIFLGLSDSYEQYYQAIRRCWRFGQKRLVNVHIVVTDHETEILENVRRKEIEAESLSSEIVHGAQKFEIHELGKVLEVEEGMNSIVHEGDNWRLVQGDCVEGLRALPESSIDLSIFSPPFIALYTYSASERDLGNSKTLPEFFHHFRFVADELLRVTKPGRLACVHTAQVAATLIRDGYIGLIDFRGKTIDLFETAGWRLHGEVVIDKDPQAQAIRTHSKGLLFVQLKKDSSWLRPALADYILVFRKPGENEIPIHPDISNNEWIEWARPVWYGIRESDTLNAAEARTEKDDRHICPLQLGTIERCIRLWSNPGETILSPFAGIGSEGYEALRLGRKFIGFELKPTYALTAVKNLHRAEPRNDQLQIFASE